MVKDNCKTVFINDMPQKKDSFSGGHSDLANAIAEVIKQDSGGKTIGLEGGWGSGKSSVITMLEKNIFKDDPNYKFFVFDTWAHEGDTLRRSFLYNLLDAFKDEQKAIVPKWIENKKKTRRKNNNHNKHKKHYF